MSRPDRRPDRPEVPPQLPRITQVRVLYADTDAMGVVYHGAYIRYLEHARIEYLRARGAVYAEIEAAGFAVPVTAMALRYTAPARFDDQLTLTAALVHQTRARLRFAYRLTVEPGDRRAENRRIEVLVATTDHCCLNPTTGRPVPFPADLHHRLAAARRADEAALAPSPPPSEAAP